MKRRTFLISGSAGGGALALGLGRPRQVFAAKTLRLFTPEADPSQIKAWNALFEDYTAKKNKDVVIKGEFAKWDDITKKLAADIAAGSPPEIVAGSSKPDFVAAETKRGLILDMAPVVDALGRANFQEAALRVGQYGGVQKLPAPAKGMYGAVFSAGRTWNTHLMALIHIWSAGGFLFDEKLNVVFDSPESRRALPYSGEMAMRFSPPDVGQYGFREASAAFVSGKSATTFYWGRGLAHLYAPAPHPLPLTATVHIPRDRQHRTTLHFDEFYLHKTPNTAEATDVVKFMFQPEQVMRLLTPVVGHVVPTQKPVEPLYATHEWRKANPDIVKVLLTPTDYAVAPTLESPQHPFNYKYEVVESKNILTDCVQKIVLGKEPVGKAVEWAHKQMVDATKGIKD